MSSIIGALITLLVAVVAASVRVAALQRRVRTLERQAITDPLTGAFNRRHMHSMLSTAIERHQRSGETASLLLLDVDGFKAVNDAAGHAEGDRVLKAIVAVIHRRLRRVDALFRTGGDEFVVLLAGAGAEAASGVAEELCMAFAHAEPLHDWRVSISAGVAEVVSEATPAEWLAEADEALYNAKAAGGSCIRGRITPAFAIRKRTS